MANNNKLGTIALNYGLLWGIIGVVLAVVSYATGAYDVSNNSEDGKIYTYLSYPLALLFPILAILKFKKAEGGFISFGQGFKMTFLVFLYSTILSVVWMLVYTLVLEPGYVDLALENIERGMLENNPNMTDEEVEFGMSISQNMMSPGWLTTMVVIVMAFWGAIEGLILGAIFQKKRPPHMEVDTEDFGSDSE